jgi:SGNH hydrolase-like domain, acetyltransferase AlgX
VGGDAPEKPTRSLPSYREPTPETHQQLTREEEAELALKNTVFTAGTNILLVTLFLVTIAAVPAIQFAAEWRVTHSVRRLPSFTTFGMLGSRFNLRALRHPSDLWEMLPRPDETKSIQKTLQTDSVVAQWLLPRVQSVITGVLHAGNEQAYLGRGDWLFYRSDVDYVIGEGFLDPARMKRRTRTTGVQPDPIKAIVEFRDQLAHRGIDLIIMPVPVKPSIDGQKLSPAASGAETLENPSFTEFKANLQKRGIQLFDPATLLAEETSSVSRLPLYLKADTHWRPETMELVAQQLAKRLTSIASASPALTQIEEKKISGLGDIARMLKLPDPQTLRYVEEITVHQVTTGNAMWRPSKNADVLLLGDSFSNIFSQAALGWGESAGFAEQLSHALGGRPIDCISRNSDGAFATREILARELARGRDRLAGKKLIVWQFATRELVFGNWKLINMALRPPVPARFFTPSPGEKIVITGTIESISTVPRPGSVPYADHIMALHLVDASIPQSGSDGLQCLVYLFSMRDNVWTPAAHLRPGDRITLRLRPWTDVSGNYEQINRSEIDDPAVQLEEPAWSELIE